MATCGGDKQPFLWDVSTGQVIRKFRGHEAKINSISFNSEDTVLATGSYDRSVLLWDCKSRSIDPIQRLSEAKDSVSCVALDPPFVFSSSIDGNIRRYDVRIGLLATDLVGPPVTSIALSKDHNCVLAGTLDNAVRLFDRRCGELLNEYRGHENTKYKLECCLSFSDAQVLSGSEDGPVFVWDLVEAKQVSKLSGHTLASCSLSYHPRSDHLLSGGCDGTVILWSSPAAPVPQ